MISLREEMEYSVQLDPLTRKAIELDIALIGRIVFTPAFEGIRPISIMGVNPYLSLVLKESIGRLGLQVEQLGFRDSARSRLFTCRNEVKILAHEAPIESLLLETQDLIQAYTDGFQELHSGRRFAALWRILQPDLGLYFREGQFVSNTFTLHQDIGLTADQARAIGAGKDEVGSILYQDSREYGQMIGAIATALGVDEGAWYLHEPQQKGAVEGFQYRDVKSTKWLQAAQEQMGEPPLALVYLILNVLSRIQIARHIASVYVPQGSWEELKMKLIYSFHAVASIEKVIGYDARNTGFSSEVRSEMRSILGKPTSKSIKAIRTLRNFVVHYGLLPETLSDLRGAEDFDSLVQVTTRFSSVATLLDVVNEHLLETSALLGKYFDLSLSRTQVL